jgi:hypothetical protein
MKQQKKGSVAARPVVECVVCVCVCVCQEGYNLYRLRVTTVDEQ